MIAQAKSTYSPLGKAFEKQKRKQRKSRGKTDKVWNSMENN